MYLTDIQTNFKSSRKKGNIKASLKKALEELLPKDEYRDVT